MECYSSGWTFSLSSSIILCLRCSKHSGGHGLPLARFLLKKNFKLSILITNVKKNSERKIGQELKKKNTVVPVFSWPRKLSQGSRGHSVQFSSVAQSCPTLCDPMNRSTPGLPVHHLLPEFTETHVHRVSDAIQPSHPLLSPSPPAPNPSQNQSLFQWVNSSHEVAKVLEFQL